MVQIGKQIQDFEFEIFQNEQFKKVHFSDYKNKWLIILFYPADFTFVCPTELGEAADHYEEYKKLGAEVISMSTDTVYVHKAWHDESPIIKKIQYPMGADPTGKICQEFGTYIEEEGLSLRGTFIINPEGIVKAMDIHDNSIGRSSIEIIRKLQASIYVQEHKGEVCPASWKPGAKTLKPSINLVEKI
ncbi:MAG: redoxin domain-containing protein [bacterium]|nr:redoxin domain-containing protein [bacterium]